MKATKPGPRTQGLQRLDEGSKQSLAARFEPSRHMLIIMII